MKAGVHLQQETTTMLLHRLDNMQRHYRDANAHYQAAAANVAYQKTPRRY